MATVCIVYGSETGNTKRAAEIVAAGLLERGHGAKLMNAAETGPEVFAEPCDALLFGVSTWGAVEEEVCQDFLAFYDELARADLKGRRVAVFGCGDSGYDRFCKAVDFVEQRALGRGAALILGSLKIDKHPKDSPGLTEGWTAKLAQSL